MALNQSSKPQIVKFNDNEFGIREAGENDRFYYLDIRDAMEGDHDDVKRFINWHKDSEEYEPGGEAFGWCQGTAKEVFEAWKWLNCQGDNSVQGVPITAGELENAVEEAKQ